MKCVKCGYEIYEGDTCPLCGCKNSTTNSSGTSSTGAETSYTQTGDTGFTPADTAEVSIESSYSMKWYKVLKVILWFGIISNVISAFTYFTGSTYQGFEDELYEMLPSLKTLDMFEGVLCIAMTVFTFIVWRALHNYKANGPKMLTVMYIINIASYAIYMFAFSSILGGAETTTIYGDTYIQGMYQYQEYLDLTVLQSASVAPTIMQIIGGIVMIIANRTYFKNRADLFVY